MANIRTNDLSTPAPNAGPAVPGEPGASDAPPSPASATGLPTEAELRTADLALDAGQQQATEQREARIRERAYQAYQRRGGQPGDDVQDWLEAERSIDAPPDGPSKRE